jgi:hypothetical protein
MKHEMRRQVAAAGLIALLVGLLGAGPLLRDILNQAQNKCDYLPCVWLWTVPTLGGFGVLAAAGAVLLAWAVFGPGGLIRKPRQ